MRLSRLTPLLGLAALAACSDGATAPLPEIGLPAFAVSPGSYPGSIDGANAPSGAHLQTGTIFCTVSSALVVSCSTYEFAGVGHTNVDIALVANYSAIVDCYNPGVNPNNPIESHETSFSAERHDTAVSLKNGRLRIPAESVNPNAVAQGCPNPNWTPTIRAGTLALDSFTYTVTFEGFTDPAVMIAEP